MKRKDIIKILQKNKIECRPIVTGNFVRNEVMKYFDYEVHKELKNADHLHDNGLFVNFSNGVGVDDDEAVRDSLKWLLEGNGYSVKVFENAEQLLDTQTEQETSLAGCLILDVRMPGITGIELHDELLTKKINIPTIGIGASNNCDGQILVFDDLIGLNPINVRFVKKYSNIRKEMTKAVASYARDVRKKKFPLKKHSY